MNKTQVLTASRAGLRSVIVTDAGAAKTQVISDVGAVTGVPSGGGVFILHPFV
jgi:hypothetical protein